MINSSNIDNISVQDLMTVGSFVFGYTHFLLFIPPKQIEKQQVFEPEKCWYAIKKK